MGGLSSVIAEANSTSKKLAPQLSIALPDKYFNGGDYKDLLRKHNLSPEKIAKNILKKINKS